MPTRGAFITIEGGEGSGKSTQIARLAEMLEGRGVSHLITREPGGTALGEQVRGWLLQRDAAHDRSIEAEILLFLAARVEHVRQVITPALEGGKLVISDRFHDSSRIYQLYSHGKPVSWYDRLHQLTLGTMQPDMTLLLDLDPAIGLERIRSRTEAQTRYEQDDLAYHQRLRQGFLELAKREPERFTVIDASRNVEEVHQAIGEALQGWVA